MKDAVTQTDRSDYSIIKAKLLKERQQLELKKYSEIENNQNQKFLTSKRPSV